MLKFIARRLLTMLLLLVMISMLTVFLMWLAPGDALSQLRGRPDVPAATIRRLEQQYGYKDANGNPNPPQVRYVYWLNTISPIKFTDESGRFTWNYHQWHYGGSSLGESIVYQIPVTQLLAQRVPATLALEVCALLFAWCVAVPLGVMAAVKKDSWADRLSAIFAYGALSMPEYFVGILALKYLAAETGWFPYGGWGSFDHEFLSPGGQLWDHLRHLVLPTLVLGLAGIASMMRVMRSSTLDYLRAEFVTTARAKGVPEGRVLFFHVLRNAINPLITAFGFAIGSLLSGAVLVEYVMSYPGLGRLVYEALLQKDEYVVMAAVLVGSIILVLGNMLADILLAWSDPRIRLESESSSAVPHTRGALKLLLGAGVVLAALVFDAWCLPHDNPKAMSVVVDQMKIGIVVALVAAGIILFSLSWPVLKKLARSLPRHPLTAVATCSLVFMYGCALFAPLLSSQEIGLLNLRQTYHPPTRLTWHDGRLCAQQYVNANPSAAQYEPVAGVAVPLKFFGHGFKYNLLSFLGVDRERVDNMAPGLGRSFLSLFNSDRHLLVPDYEAFEKQQAKKVNPLDYPFFLLGSDATGRDVYSRLLYGGQISLTIGLVGIGITMTLGFLVGGLSGYFGGAFDFVAMRFVEFLMAIPTLYLLLSLRAALADRFEPAEMYLVIIVILSLIGWTGAARVLRGMSLSLRERPFVAAAESMGQSTFRILFKHFLPNLAGYLLVAATLSIPGYILGEAALSFLNLGIQDPSASWGLMLSQAQDMKVIMLGFWWMLLPGAAIIVTVFSFNILGDALRDIVDPKMKTR